MQKGKKIILVNPPDTGFKKVDKDKAGGLGTVNFYETAPNPPVDLLRTAALLEKEGHDISILESVIDELDDDAAIARLEKPEYIGIRLSLPSLDKDLRFVDSVKQKLKDSVVFVFGNVIKDTYDRWVQNSQADCLIFGEPEAVVKDFVLGKRDNIGVIWKKDGHTQLIASWQYVEELNALPPPAWHLIPLEKYVKSRNPEDFTFFLVTSEGCPYHCKMCPYLATQGNRWRPRDTEKVMEELVYLKKRFNAKKIQTRDACLDADKGRLEVISELIIGSGLKFDFTIELNLENLDQNLIEKLARAGTTTIMTGIESMSEERLSEIGQRGGSLKKIKRNVSLCRTCGMKVIGFFMLGFPDESWRSLSLLIKRARRLSLDLYDFTILTPYFGTGLYKELVKDGVMREVRYSDFDSYTPILATSFLDIDELNFSRVYASKVLSVFNFRRHFKNAILSADINYAFKNLWRFFTEHLILIYLNIKVLCFKIRRWLK